MVGRTHSQVQESRSHEEATSLPRLGKPSSFFLPFFCSLFSIHCNLLLYFSVHTFSLFSLFCQLNPFVPSKKCFACHFLFPSLALAVLYIFSQQHFFHTHT